MMFEFPVSVAELLDERARQFAGWGISWSAIDRVRQRVRDMWGAGADGWVPCWSDEARGAQTDGRWLDAALCWGAARFPVVCNAQRQDAYRHQLMCYCRVAPEMPVPVQRVVCTVPYRQARTSVPVHVLRPSGAVPRALLVICGGVDTWKVELHQMAMRATKTPGLAVATVDMPGTGESEVRLAPDADEILVGVLDTLMAQLGVTRAGFLGVSFGGHWAAKLALTGRVDAAVDLGGPVGATDKRFTIDELPNGMPGILGNVLGLSGLPSPADAECFTEQYSLEKQGLLNTARLVPLLVANGVADPYVPQADTTTFRRFPGATVWLVRDAGHCASEQLPVVLPAALEWLAAELLPDVADHGTAVDTVTTLLVP